MDEVEIKYNLLKEIITVTKALYMLKEQLLVLEKNSEAYNCAYLQYQQLLKMEDELYNKVNNDSNTMLDFLNYLDQRYDFEEYDISIYYIKNIKNNIIYKRIANKLNNYIFKLPLEKLPELEKLNEKEMSKINHERNVIRNKIMTCKILENDYLQLFVKFLDTFIVNFSYVDFREDINCLKSDLLFAFCELEETSIINIEKPVFIKSKIQSDILGLSENDYDEIKKDLIYTVTKENLSYSLWNETSGDVTLEKIILHALLLTSFSLLENDTYYTYLKQIKEYVGLFGEDREYCIDFIKQIENDIDESRNKYRVISLRKTKSL